MPARSSSTLVIVVGLLVLPVESFVSSPTTRTARHRTTPLFPTLRPARPAACERSSRGTPASGFTSNSTSRSSRTVCAAADPSAELVIDPSLPRSIHRDVVDPSVAGIEGAGANVLVQEARWAGGEEAEEEVGWVEDSADFLSKGAEAVGAGVKSVALASTPLKRKANGRIVPDGQGLLNLCILVFSGLWAVHSIVTVDSAMWRGWTMQETLMRLPWDNWDSYESGLQTHPIFTKTAINVGIYLIGDWLSQVNWGREADVALWEFDLQRTLRNGLIGAFFGPLVHYYYDFSDWILPPNVGVNRPLKIILDQSIYFVTKCAVYISLVSLLRGDSLEETQETVKARLKGVVTTGWRFWPFVHVFTYFLIPARHRVLWVNCVDLLWSSILAGMTSGKPDDEGDDERGEEGEGGAGLADKDVDGTVRTSASPPAAAAPAAAVKDQQAQP